MGRIREVFKHYRTNKAVWAALVVLLLLTLEFFLGVTKPFFNTGDSSQTVVAHVLTTQGTFAINLSKTRLGSRARLRPRSSKVMRCTPGFNQEQMSK